MLAKNDLKACKPPAEAPMPTIRGGGRLRAPVFVARLEPVREVLCGRLIECRIGASMVSWSSFDMASRALMARFKRHSRSRQGRRVAPSLSLIEHHRLELPHRANAKGRVV
jgi:hypothetical protein